ncbi:MAG: hypothetical protein ACR2J8_10385 [Thermomicrobiales bacterium]
MDTSVQSGHGVISKLRFDERAVAAVAQTFGVTSQVAPFRLPSGAVYQITIEDEHGKPAVMLTLWPTIRRIDAIAAGVTVVATRVSGIEIVGGVEVTFRRESGEYLIVTRQGKVIVRA